MTLPEAVAGQRLGVERRRAASMKAVGIIHTTYSHFRQEHRHHRQYHEPTHLFLCAWASLCYDSQDPLTSLTKAGVPKRCREAYISVRMAVGE